MPKRPKCDYKYQPRSLSNCFGIEKYFTLLSTLKGQLITSEEANALKVPINRTEKIDKTLTNQFLCPKNNDLNQVLTRFKKLIWTNFC